MARYDEYAAGGLDAEIADANANQQARDDKGRFIPERFKGKDITDVIQSYEELEKLNSRQSQDVGALRRQVEELTNAVQTSGPAQEPSKPVTVDDIYEDADATLRRVVREESTSEIEDLKKELDNMRVERRLSQIDDKFTDWRTKAQTSEFSTWIQESPYRARLVQEADAGDFDAAEELLGMYYESEAQADTNEEVAAPVSAAQQLADAMLETGSPAPKGTDDVYSGSELMELRISAKKGDLRAERWLAAHADSIANAYAEGRIVD